MRFAPLEVEIDSVVVILWAAKVVNKSKKSKQPLIFCPKTIDLGVKNVSKRRFGMEIPSGKIDVLSLQTLVGENYHSEWFSFLFPASNHDCL